MKPRNKDDNETDMKLRKFLLVICMAAFATTSATAQLHTFSNGEVADAAKINENFQYVLNNATGSSGCSATQDGSSVLITCADGTSGVLASAGTVIFYPQGITGEAPLLDLPTGAFVIVDANGVILARSEIDEINDPDFGIFIDFDNCFIPGFCLNAYLVNDSDNQSVRLLVSRRNAFVYYLSTDCSGEPLVEADTRWLMYLEGFGFGLPAPNESNSVQILVKSRVRMAYWETSNKSYVPQGICETTNQIKTLLPMVSYSPPQEILNAAYPVRLEQLP